MANSDFLKSFYPTPDSLIHRMLSKIDNKMLPREPKTLEPSAGQGHIYDYMKKSGNALFSCRENKYCIEPNTDFQAALIGKGYRMLASDFLTYSGADKFDLIIANPPFEAGDLHLLKAIDLMYNGQIVFLLNAETLKNPYSNARKLLVQKLKDLNADIEYIPDAFNGSEVLRKTNVEVALVYIKIENDIQTELFDGADDKAREVELEEDVPLFELSTGNRMQELVADYNRTVRVATETIMSYYRNHKYIGHYIKLNEDAKSVSYSTSKESFTQSVQRKLNTILTRIRQDFWKKVLELEPVRTRMTAKVRDQFDQLIQNRSHMDFTVANISTFITNIVEHFKVNIRPEILKLFNKFTVEHWWDGEKPYSTNTHYFNGWKTNQAWKCGKKVIIPLGNGDAAFQHWMGHFPSLDYRASETLDEFDVVWNYLDGMKPGYKRTSEAVKEAFEQNQTKGIKSTYFTVDCYKKGTIHITFNDEGLLRKFNIVACQERGWLPDNYGEEAYSESEHADVIDSFEGEKSYTENVGVPSLDFNAKRILMIGA